MSLLLVVVLFFFSSSCSVSSGQYYVSDDCSSVTQSPCNPLSVYAGNMSQYNNTILYFIGTTNIDNYHFTMTAVKNVTLHGLDQSPSINCRKRVYGINGATISLHYSDHVTISNLSFSDCPVEVNSSNNFTITNSVFASRTAGYLSLSNAFDVKVSSVTFIGCNLVIEYNPLPVCSSELLHYSLILTDVTSTAGNQITLGMNHGTSYNISIIFDHVQYYTNYILNILFGGLFNFFITNSSFKDVNYGPGFPIEINEKSKSNNCTYPGVQITSILVLKNCQIYNNKEGLRIISNEYLLKAVNYHIIIKSCLIYDNTNEGLYVDAAFLRFLQIEITDTELIGNGGNKIMNSNAISLSNVTVANSTYTGLSLTASLVTISNNFIFKNNTGVVGGGLAINDSSRLILTSSANLEFIDNHASYKGGGIYVEESSDTDIILIAPYIPLTLINNSAGLVGGDMYGVYSMTKNQFSLTNPNICSTGNPIEVCF
uniref:Right handed beta helix domain-containing protein n=1 Tax=Amphimedon queenslandica TaxID=400682 RepID=A0A1X7TR94_AMPQE